jgi:hypothetical protein
MNHAHEEDRQLLTRCLDGDRGASEAFVKKFSGLVYRSAQHTLILKGVAFNKQDLEDLHNTVFLQLFENNLKKLRQYQGKNGCSLSSWIRLVAVRIVLNHFRKKGLMVFFGRRNKTRSRIVWRKTIGMHWIGWSWPNRRDCLKMGFATYLLETVYS